MKVSHFVSVRNWPASKPTTKNRKTSQFVPNRIPGAAKRVEDEVKNFSICTKSEEWRTKELKIYCKGEKNENGRFKDTNVLLDPKVVVCFDLDGVDYLIPCDAFESSAMNLCAIAETIRALRANERYGVLTIKQMMEGVAELPMVSSAERPAWWNVLNVDRNASLDEINASYRKLAAVRHRDLGGTDTEWHELQEAIKTAREVKGS